MNKEIIVTELNLAKEKTAGAEIITPGMLSPIDTAAQLVNLLQLMYVEHGVTKNVEKLVDDISSGNIKTWFAKKDGQFVATTSLIKQNEGWETGRSVSLIPGSKLGKRLILEAAADHINNHDGEPLIAEVRLADEYKGIPDSLATQWLSFGILGLVPHALAPLFGHGDPFRHETFALSASNISPDKTIRERVFDAINNRGTKGNISKLQIVQDSPFRLLIPSNEGMELDKVVKESRWKKTCTLIAVEASDSNMPLVSALLKDKNVFICGTDKSNGAEGKPVLLFTTFSEYLKVAPTKISETVPKPLREDLRDIANQFTSHGNKRLIFDP